MRRAEAVDGTDPALTRATAEADESADHGDEDEADLGPHPRAGRYKLPAVVAQRAVLETSTAKSAENEYRGILGLLSG